MILTPYTLECAYELLRSQRPLSGWKLPEPDDVEFHVTNFEHYGETDWRDGTPVIRISSRVHGHLKTLLATMAHEMIHLHLDRKGVRSAHGREFRNCAREVCRRFGFDPKEFVI